MFFDRRHIGATHDEYQIALFDVEFAVCIRPGEPAAVYHRVRFVFPTVSGMLRR